MKNNILFLIKNKLIISVKGNNIERFIKRLKSNNIEILSINYIANNEINLKIYKNDYDKINKIKTIYEVNILKYEGCIKFLNNILDNQYIIIFLILSLIGLYIITSLIFEIDIVTNDSKMEETLKNELNILGLSKYKFKKSFNELQIIKKKIIENHRDEIEWIEIENIGTKYIIRYEPRIKNKKEEEIKERHIIAKKDCVIKELNISSGQIVKGINSYVKKGDIIVSGYIELNGNIKSSVISKGKVLGEVWYKIDVTYPFLYNEIKETGKMKNVFVIKILNNEFELSINKYKNKKTKDNTLLKNNLLPIKFMYQKQKETIIINEKNTEDEVITKALDLSKEKISKNLKEGEYINNYKILSKTIHEDSITLNVFFSVIEDVGEYLEIDGISEEIVE